MIETYLNLVAHPLLWTFVALVVVFYLIQLSVTPDADDATRNRDTGLLPDFGLDKLPRLLVLVGALVWGTLVVALVSGLFWIIWKLGSYTLNETEASAVDLRWSLLTLTAQTAALGAVVALPFSLLRVQFSRRQTTAAEGQVDTALAQVEVAQQGQVTDRINKAVEGLGVEKSVSRIGRAVKILTGMQTRVTHQVELNAEYPQISPRSKITGVSDSYDQIKSGTENEVIRAKVVEVTTWSDELTKIEWEDEQLEYEDGDTFAAVGDWQPFSKTQPNLEVRIGAIYALERIAQDSDRDHIRIMEILCAYTRENAPASLAVPFPIEWRKAFAADWDAEGVKRPDRKAIQKWAGNLKKPRTDIQVALEVIGRRSEKQIALERAATVRGSDVGYPLDLRGTCLQGADMAQMNFDHVQLTGARLQGARLVGAQLQGAHLFRAQLQGAVLFRAQLQGAHLGGAQLQGADLFRAQFDASTSLSAATLRGAALREVDCTTIPFSQAQIDAAFGDASVTLGHLTKPKHWDQGKEPLDWGEFEEKWYAYMRSIGMDPDNPK